MVVPDAGSSPSTETSSAASGSAARTSTPSGFCSGTDGLDRDGSDSVFAWGSAWDSFFTSPGRAFLPDRDERDGCAEGRLEARGGRGGPDFLEA